MALLRKAVLWAGSPGLGRVVNPDALLESGLEMGLRRAQGGAGGVFRTGSLVQATFSSRLRLTAF